jgi:hypothetical protein
MSDKRKAWEQLDNESNEAFVYFKIYRDMDIRRSCTRVAKIAEVADTTVQYHCTQYNWVDRVMEYDRHLDRLFVREHENAVVAMRRRQIKTSLKAQELAVDQINKHLKQCQKVKEPMVPIHQIAKLVNIVHSDERVNRDVPDAIIRLEAEGIDYDKLSAEQLIELDKLVELAKKENTD